MNEIILVGNPNVGKTTLYNTMTKSFEKASNWHGVTVGTKTKKYNYDGEEYTVTDVPGLYSLSPYSNEEKIAKSYLESHKDHLVICICDANNLRRNIVLAHELKCSGYSVMIALNMYKEASYNLGKIERLTGMKIVKVDARKSKSVGVLQHEIQQYFNARKNIKNVENCNKKIKNCNINEIFDTIDSARQNPYKVTDKIDAFLTKKYIFLPIFLLIILLIFYLTFGVVGSTICSMFTFVVEKLFFGISYLINSLNIAEPIKLFFTDGVLGAVLTIAGFIPQIVMMMFFLNLIEDIGLMSRVAFMFDGILKKFGLTGKSLFSIMMGYGCTASAVMTTRNLENKNLRKRTALLLPFASCTAKLPVFLVIASLFFEKYKFLIIFALYLFAIFVGLIFAKIYRKAIPDTKDVFILEMPKYRMCNMKKIFADVFVVVKDFLIKVGSMILLLCSIVWVLQNFSCSFEYLETANFERSILYAIANFIAPVFRPIGLGDVGVVAALLLGLVAKEMVVVGLAMINGVTGSISALSLSLKSATSICHFSPATSITFLIFILLYTPCISAIMSIKGEFGRKTAAYVFVCQFVISYLVAGLTSLVIYRWEFIFVLVIALAVDIVASVVIRYRHKKNNCRGNCNACRKI